jgi:hypothetical protein
MNCHGRRMSGFAHASMVSPTRARSALRIEKRRERNHSELIRQFCLGEQCNLVLTVKPAAQGSPPLIILVALR